MREGEGTTTWADGTSFTGAHKGGFMHKGTYFAKDGVELDRNVLWEKAPLQPEGCVTTTAHVKV